MLELLGGDPEFVEPSSIPMPSKFSFNSSDGFEERDGCIVLRSVPVVAATRRSLERRDDETGIEAALTRSTSSVSSASPLTDLSCRD